MTADAFVNRWTRPARRRGIANDLAIGLPLVLAATTLAWRSQGMASALAIGLAGFGIVVAAAVCRARRFDRNWLVRRLDASRPDMEDSADLLLRADDSLGPLQQLQRGRLQARLADDAGAALRPDWRNNAIAVAWLLGLVLIAGSLWWPAPSAVGPSPPGEAAIIPGGVPRLVAQRLRVVPPGYTRLPVRDIAGLDTRAPQGSRLQWTLRFAPNPARVDLLLIDGSRLALRRSGADWTLVQRLDRSLLYRVVTSDRRGPLPALHRIDAVADAAPVIRVINPERTLTLMTRGQRRWNLAFEVTDDHGVAPAARLRLIVTQGEGENITFRESALTLTGSGPAQRRRFAIGLDIARFGLTVGNDLVAQISVTDNRAPVPQTVRGPSLILRWPPDRGTEAGGLDGMVKTVLPAYFRSQRQIIIDAEALQRERRRLPAERLADRSNALGIDQSILRQRYGRFLGDETSAEPALPTNDAPAPVTSVTDASALPDGHGADDGHDHGGARTSGGASGVGNAGDVLAEYGHAHDESDAATLIDPETRAALRKALDAMFESERNLRQGQPDNALPHAYVALRLIKQVQQATRIYLSRTGPDLPAIDPSRRLGGDRKGLGTPRLAPASREEGDIDAVPAAAWRALAGPGDVRLNDIQRWVDGAGTRVGDPLAFAAAIDAVARDPACLSCRRALRSLLWQALKTPPAQVPRRPVGDDVGRRYLDALR
jgi:hypothetical protein